MRLDKFLAQAGYGSRKEIKNYIRKGYVCVNNQCVTKDDLKIDENNDIVLFDGEVVNYLENVYIMMNKPKNTLCVNEDSRRETVFDYVSEFAHRDLFTVGRLDIDTTGLLLITDDGDFAHHIISPKHNVDKVYRCKLQYPITDKQIELLEKGIEFKDFTSLPSLVEKEADNIIHLTIHEGKFHQVKRMLLAVGNEVVELHRESIGGLKLDPTLQEGDYRLLTEEEIQMLIED